ncbi:uncharacterized protein [Panulirus ornatus]|uniref:uncharacterized protein isoform X4 n=1 Tax=Panulirus ornatus TaxID=150431 RepID=UPI003A891C4E
MGLQYVAAVCIVAAVCVYQVLAYPIAPEGSGREDGWSSRDYVHATVGVAAMLSSVTTLLACVCCKRSRGFKRSDSGLQELGSVSSRVEGSTTTISHGPREEFTMFPPAGLSQLSLSTTQINFEPLPDIRPRLGTRSSNQQITDRTLPPSFPGQAASTPTGLHTDEWFAEPHQNFPRNQLQYVREIGKGWFGQVLEGRATGIFSDHTKGDSPVTSSVTPNTSSRGQTPVAVKILREDATPTEQMYFLHELRPYRDLSHPNVLKVLAHCLETEPFLILMQLCPRGDLKAVVKHDKSLRESALLRMILDVASGLMHMHSYSFIHTDLAARNCIVDEDYVVKIGDYGYNIDFYKNEYYCAGDVALPLRWCAPETLRCTDTTIETKEVTKAANVWSFGVMIWEIVSRGEMPYTNLDDDQVIQQVIVDQTCLLEPPKSLVLHADKLFDIMKLCWDPEYCRPPMTHIHSLLMHLWENSSVACQDTSSISDFEQRWDQLQQQHCRDHSIVHGGNSSDLRFESDFSLSVSGHRHLGGAMSPSLQNLHGSVEDLDAKMAAKFGSALPSWLGVEPGQPIDSLTQEITDAILKLDDYLAGEKSEPSTTQTSPEKGGINFKLGKDSFVSNPPESKIAQVGRLSVEEGSGHPSLTRTLSEGEDEGFSLRLEQGEFTEMVRLKSQSVQDFMKLTVVDDGSDSDNASQRNSLAFETLAQEKTYSSESNIREALRDMKFMGELERLQAQHRYSIITEASRENPSSIEYRIQDFNVDPSLSRSEILLDSEAGSTDRLATGTDSDNSNNFLERQNSEQDPFLGEVNSSESTEERKDYYCNVKEGNNNSFHSLDTSVGPKPLPASPDCVVSSREPKPVTLPDIVVHDASVKLSTPSPPPVESSLKVMNSSQPKEFRFIFEDQSDPSTAVAKFSYVDVHEKLPHIDSVTFSENIRNAEVHRIEEFGNSDKEGNSCQKVNSIDANDSPKVKKLSDNDHEEDSHKMGDLTKFLDYVQENPRERLTSTPCKKDDGNILKPEEMEEKAYSSTFLSNGSDNQDGSCIVDKNLYVDGENLSISKPDTKQRLVFGSNIDKTEDENHSTKEEHTVLEVEDNLKSPSYKPEKIVKGEDVVIGALEDYSLDLYRAVKSTEVIRSGDESVQVSSLPVEENVEEHSSVLSNKSSYAENKVSGIEFDLEQWDRFLGSAMNGEKATSETIFKESFDENAGVKCDLVNDVLGDAFEKTENNSVSQKEIEPFLKVYPKCSSPNKLDLSSTFEHSTCDEICAVMASDSNVESSFVESRPEVNVNMFFSSNSNISNDSCLQHTSDSGQNGPSNVYDIESFLNDSTNQKSKFSDESYFTAESSTFTTELVSPREVSELYDSATSHFDSESRTPINETSSVDAGNSTFPKTNQVNDAQCSPNISYGITDTPSDSFTYMRESSVDSTFEVVNHSEASFLGKQPKCKDEVNKVDSCLNSAVNIPDPSICGDELDAVLIKSKNSFKSDVNSGIDVNDCSMKSSVKNDVSLFKISTPVDSGFSMTSNILNLEDASSASNTDSSVLRLEEIDSNTQENFTLRDEDDLSPSAYKNKLKYNDCWTSQESQDSAVENDEAENGDFWQQQMMAWQEAAFQTRQLLQQAAGGSGTSSEGHKGSQEDLEASPRSDSSSTKSPYSSSDMLSLDDEGTYVSYNTTDDEEVLGYKPEDISALRAELNRKLGGLQEDKEQLVPEELDETSSTDREDRENIVINYRGIMATTLSPIKEESFLEDDDSPARKLNNKCSGNLESFHDQSIEFEEPSLENLADKPTNDDKVFTIHEAVNNIIVNGQQPGVSELPSCEDILDTNMKNSEERKISDDSCAAANEVQKNMSLNLTVETLKETLSLENAHDSLILEDLDDDGPSSIQIYNSGNSADAEDILIVDTETNEATIVDRGKPRSHLAFINDHEKEVETNEIQLYTYEESDDVAPESIPSVGRSCFDEMHHRHHILTNNNPLEKPESLHLDGCVDSESKLERQFVTDDVSSESPQGIQVPHYHSYFTSALSTISHPNASIEEPPLFEEVEHISLPYDVNYPSAGEQLHSLEDFGEQGEETENHISNNNEEETKISEIEDDDDAPIKLNFLGRLYSDESEEQDEKNNAKSSEAREALIFSGSEKESDADKQVARPKTPEPSDISQMTASEFLASQKCQINDHEEIEEQIEIDAGYDEDSEDDENSPRLNPGKLNQVEFHVTQDPRYTPDWESDSDSDGDSSSTSGEFMWRPGEQCQQSSYILDVIEEEPENDAERVDDDGDFSEDSESGEEEFTPSKWNCDLTPSHSLLRSPQNRSSLKKRVRWKRQRHHRVYEYPPEPRSWEPTPTEPNPRRSWGRSSLDYLSLADWELGADEFIADDGGDMEDYVYRKPSRPAPPPPIYSLGSVAYDDAAEGFLVDNGEFFIRSSGSPFTFTSSTFSASDFFPGSHSSDYDVIFGGPSQTPGLSDALSNKLVDHMGDEGEEMYDEQMRESKSDTENHTSNADVSVSHLHYQVVDETEQSSSTNTGLGQLRHTRDKLRLEIPTISLTGDATKSTTVTHENGQNELEKCNGQNFTSLNLTRTEPEVSEV